MGDSTCGRAWTASSRRKPRSCWVSSREPDGPLPRANCPAARSAQGSRLMGIHPTAIVDPSANLAPDVTVGAYSIVGADVAMDAGCVLGPHVVVGARTRLGKRNRIFQFASIGEIAQD